MEYLFAIIMILLEVIVIISYLRKINLFEVYEENKKLWNSKAGLYICVSWITVCLIISTITIISNVSNIVNFVKLIVLLGVLMTAAVVDLKKKIIPNVLIVFGLSIRLFIYIVEYFAYNDIFLSQIKSDIAGFLLGFGVFFIAAIVSRGAIGFGDVKLFAVIGLTSGVICTYSTMMISLVVSTIVSIFFIVTKKKDKKDAIPFGPCIFLGYFISVLLTNY